MERNRSLLALILVLPLVGAISAGCNSGTEEPAPPPVEKPTDSSTSAQVPSKPMEIDPSRFPAELQGEMTAEVPSNLPEGLPVYPGAAPAQGRGFERDGKDMSALQLLTNDSPGEAYDYYQSEFESNGWTIDKSQNMGAGAAISVNRGNCRAAILIAPAEGGGSDIYTMSECDEGV
jgi:hypothetical protein